MKRFLIYLFALLMLASPSYAARDIDATTPFNAGQNWGALKDTILPKIDDAPISVNLENISAASSAYAPGTVTGKLVQIWVTLLGIPTVADALLRVEVNGDDVSPAAAALRIPFGSPAGSTFLLTPALARAVTPGSILEVGTDGGSTTDVDATVVFKVQRYP